MALRLRPLTEKEAQTIKKWSQSRTEAARLVEDFLGRKTSFDAFAEWLNAA